MKIAHLGDSNSYTYMAMQELSLGSADYISATTIAGCIKLVDNGSVDMAVVPIENSVEGTVTETEDTLFDSSVYISKEIVCSINHSLIGIKGASIGSIKKVYSHTQAINQCRHYLAKTFPSAEIIPVSSTSKALELIKDKSECAIARKPLDGQAVLQNNIQDYKDNATRFLLLQKNPSFVGSKCSVILSISNEPGQLLKALQVFADANLNLTKIQSRPAKTSLGKYIFYIDFKLNGGKDELNKFLPSLQAVTEQIKFLGLYQAQ